MYEMPCRARAASAVSGTRVSPVSQLEYEKRPAKYPSALVAVGVSPNLMRMNSML
jgi:hypothetical protein